MNITIRLEQLEDRKEVEILTRKAFWREERISKIGIGCDEHYLAYTLRESPEFIRELNFVALVDGELAGNVMYSKAYVLLPDGSSHDVINFGPLSVLPKYQKMGVGSRLMEKSIEEAKQLGYGSIIFFGHPTYYPRFGFKEASSFEITTKNGNASPAFMAMELIDNDLDGKAGKFYESELFEVDVKKLLEFDKLFI